MAELANQNLTVEDLQKEPKKFLFTFYSTTRSQLHPKVTLFLPQKWKPEQAPVVVGQPQPLPRERWPELENNILLATKVQEPIRLRSPVSLDDVRSVSGQAAPVSVQALTASASRLSFDDPSIEPILGYVQGKLTGDVQIAWTTG